MINLYDKLNSQTLQLHQSFLNANINPKTVVVDDDGFLPSDVLSPYKFFSRNTIEKKGLFSSMKYLFRDFGK